MLYGGSKTCGRVQQDMSGINQQRSSLLLYIQTFILELRLHAEISKILQKLAEVALPLRYLFIFITLILFFKHLYFGQFDLIRSTLQVINLHMLLCLEFPRVK